MSEKGKRSAAIWSAAIFFALEIAAFGMLRSSSSLQNIWINRASHKLIACIWGGSRQISGYFSLHSKNRDLALENAKLMAMVLANGQEKHPEIPDSLISRNYSVTMGRIVKMSLNSSHNFIIIDKGRQDGVEPDCGIITPFGVVGIISAVSDRFCSGITLMNPRFNVSARLGRGGIVCPLSWDGIHSDKAILDAIPIKYAVSPGDTVWTSGFSTLFPPDIPIGSVTSLRSETGASASAVVELFQDFAKLDYVLIVRNVGSEEIKELEEKQMEEGI